MTSKFALLALAALLVACSDKSAPDAATATPDPAAATSTAPVAADAAEVAAPASAIPAVDQDAAWLVGTWELAYDPDNSPKDQMVFSEDGRLKLQGLDGRSFDGTYTLEGSNLTLSIDVNGSVAKLVGVVSPERDRITNDSGAYYTRLP